MSKVVIPGTFPKFKQYDNIENPGGSCNVTSLAMVAYYFGLRGNGQGQLEDQFYREMERMGLDRHSPEDLSTFFNQKMSQAGFKQRDKFVANGGVNDIRSNIDKGMPVIIHGYFTSSGHIVCIIGYDSDTQQYLIQDPNGEWYKEGYDHQATGRYWLSEHTLKLLCDDNGMWLHLFYKV